VRRGEIEAIRDIGDSADLASHRVLFSTRCRCLLIHYIGAVGGARPVAVGSASPRLAATYENKTIPPSAGATGEMAES
jgi:hypothetical protein